MYPYLLTYYPHNISPNLNKRIHTAFYQDIWCTNIELASLPPFACPPMNVIYSIMYVEVSVLEAPPPIESSSSSGKGNE